MADTNGTIVYIPVLKWKQGEQGAVKPLSATQKSQMLPIAELQDRIFDWKDEVYKKTWQEHLDKLATSTRTAWGKQRMMTTHLIKQGKADIYTVSTLKYRFRLADVAKAERILGSKRAVQELISFNASCAPAKGYSQAIADALANVPSIDAGEATLFAAAGHFDAALVDTGDKRALRAVGTLPQGSEAYKALAGKLACLEQTLHYVVGRWTFPVVNDAIASCLTADASATRCFKDGTEAAALAALQGSVDSLQADCALLAPHPFSWIA